MDVFSRDLGPEEPRELSQEGYDIRGAMELRRVDHPGFVLLDAMGWRQFAIWGRRGNEPHVPVYGIGKDDVRDEDIDIDQSEIFDDRTGIRWRDVRFIPLIDAPNVCVLLNGLSLAEAFDIAVVNDPRTDHLRHLSSNEHFCETIKQGHFFAPSRSVRLSSLECREPLGLRFFHRIEPHARSEAEKNLFWRFAWLVGSHAERFLSLLQYSGLLSDGLWRDDFRSRLPIDAAIWRRDDLEFDLLTSDIRFADSKNIEWRSVILRVRLESSSTIAKLS